MSIDTIFFVLILIMSVVIHEVAHGYMALFLGDQTAKLAGRLTLNPIPHIDPLGSIILPLLLSLLPGGLIFGWAKPVPFNPYNLRAGNWGPALVAAAGPASNLFIAVIFGLIIQNSLVLGLSPAVISISGSVVMMNIVLALFNLIPVPPLDGSKILFAILPYKWRYIENLLASNQILIILVVLFGASALISPLVSVLFKLLTGGLLG
ncbi:MAG: site-2 protease family protein [Candidatus Vogelbacteria bacterium]|nr:site-2 protease family protein [Candidatus Vogelbacteria bacterium]